MKRFFVLCIFLCGIGTQITWAQPMPRFIPYKTKRGYGYCDSNKRLLIPPRFEYAGPFWQGRAPVSVRLADGRPRYALIDTGGRYIVPPEWGWNGKNFAFSAAPGAVISRSFNTQDSLGRWGVVDIKGRLAVPALYQDRWDVYQKEIRRPAFEEADRAPYRYYAIVSRAGKMGVIDSNGQELIPIQYDSVWEEGPYWGTGLFFLKSGGRESVRYVGEPEILPFVYEKVWPYKDEQGRIAFFEVRRNGRQGIVDLNNRVVVPVVFDGVEISYGSHGVIAGFNTHSAKKFGWYSKDGTIRVPPVARQRLHKKGKFFLVTTYKDARDIGPTTLLNIKGQTIGVIPAPMENISISGDSISVISSQTREGKTYFFIANYDLRKKKPGASKLITTPENERLRCAGFGGDIKPVTYWDSTGNGRYFLWKENRKWIITDYIREYFAVRAAAGPGQADSLYGILDDKRDWKIRPQKEYQFTQEGPRGHNLSQNLLVVKKKGLYAMADTFLQLRTAWTPYWPVSYFRWQGKAFNISVTARSRPALQDTGTNGGDTSWIYHYAILDSAGNVAWNVGSKDKPAPYFRDSYDGNGSPAVFARDSNGFMGLYNPYGKALYPLLNNRYTKLEFVPNFGFLASRPVGNNQVESPEIEALLLRPDGSEWVPGLRVGGLMQSPQWIYSGYPLLAYPFDPYPPRLLWVLPEADSVHKPLFFNANGTIYADKDALPD